MKILISNLNTGINVKSDPAAIAAGGVVDAVGFDLSKEGVLEVAQGLAVNDIPTLVPAGVKQWMEKVYIDSTLYVLVTTIDGLYANGVLVDGGFTGRFKAVSFLDNIFLVNGTYAKRFDGTTVYQWGITAPTAVPTMAVGAYLEAAITSFLDVTEWTGNQVSTVASGPVAGPDGVVDALVLTTAASTTGYSYVDQVLDLTTFDTGESSTEKDYIIFWLKVNALANVDMISVYFDAGDGSFESSYYSYNILGSEGFQTLSMGGSAETLTEESTSSTSPTPILSEYQKDNFGNLIYSDMGVEHFSLTITEEQLKTKVGRTLTNQTLAFWRRSDSFKLKSGAWTALKIPKNLFLQTGEEALNWDDVVAVKVEVSTNATGAAVVSMAGLKMVGGSDLMGDYWFMYSWGRSDADGNVIHESSPSRNNITKEINIIGPVSVDRHPLVYSARPLSTDPQVNCGVFYALGGGLVDFWELAEVLDNTTLTDTLYGVGESFVTRKLTGKRNEPAPAGTDLVMLYNKIWMVGDSAYPMVLRSSEILSDGTLSPESWPPRNGYELDGNNGALKSVRVLNQALSVRGGFGEWTVSIADPTDYLEVTAARVSDKGLLGQDAIVELPTTQIYPTNGGFIESTGSAATFILSEIEPLIDSGMENARGINAGLVSYFSYTSALVGDRTAKVDLFTGEPRFCNLNNLYFDCLFYDKVNSIVYGIYNGEIFILDSGYVNSTTGSGELFAYLKSKVYRSESLTAPEGPVAWTRMEFHHNTGGVWFRCEIYVDGILRNNFPFMSTTRTRSDFRFGPHSGYDLQFVITGNYKAFAKIYFPIGVHYSG